jgi:DNA gyrase inhibitor GyrI
MIQEHFGEVHLEALPALHVARCRAVSATPEEDASRRMAEWRTAQHLTGAFRHFGFDLDVPEAQAQRGLRGYEVWTTVESGTLPAPGITLGDFPGGLYAVMEVYDPFKDPFEVIPAGWERLHHWVVNATHVRAAGHQWLEELREVNGHPVLALFHPIVPAGADTHPI